MAPAAPHGKPRCCPAARGGRGGPRGTLAGCPFRGSLPWGAAGAMSEGRRGPPGVRALGRAWQECPAGPRARPPNPGRRAAPGQHLGLPWGAMDPCPPCHQGQTIGCAFNSTSTCKASRSLETEGAFAHVRPCTRPRNGRIL